MARTHLRHRFCAHLSHRIQAFAPTVTGTVADAVTVGVGLANSDQGCDVRFCPTSTSVGNATIEVITASLVYLLGDDAAPEST